MWLSEKFTKGQAWIDLIGLANWADSTATVRGITFPVKRGEVARSELFLSKRWKWSRNRVRRFLGLLEKEEKIERKTVQKTEQQNPKNGTTKAQKTEQQTEHQKNNITSLFYIINYDKYQFDGTTNGTPEQGNAEQQSSKNDTTKGKEERKYISSGKFALEFFAPQLNGWDKKELEKSIDGIVSTRKSSQVADSVLQNLFNEWRKYPDPVINNALKTYNAKKYWENGKGEKYLTGIVRGKMSEYEKHNNTSLAQKAF